jgi:MSHA pilin protein MshD
MSMTTNSRQRGFTLIELVIFIVVVGIGVAGVLSVFSNSVKSSADPLVRKQTLAIAESLLEEILLKEYANPSGGYTGATRSQFDDVDDYKDYTSPTIVDAAGATIAGLAAYKIDRKVEVSTTTINAVTVKRIVVYVTGPQGVISLTGYRGNY